MKKLLVLLLALAMLFSLATLFVGCEDNSKKKSSSSKNDDEDEEESKEDDGSEENESKNDSVEDAENNKNSNDKKEENEDSNSSGNGNEADSDFKKAEQAFWDYIDVAQYADATKLEKIAPQEFWSSNGYDSLDEIKRTLPQAVDLYMEGMESQYGSDFQIRYTIKKNTAVEDALVSAYAKALAERSGIDAAGVEKAIALTVGSTIVTSADEEAMPDGEVVIICYNGAWYPVSINSYENEGTTEYYGIFAGDFILYITKTYLESQVPTDSENDQQITITDPESAIKNFLNVSSLGDISGLEACAPKEVWEIICQEYTLQDIKTVYSEFMEQIVQMLEEECGANLSIEVEVTDTYDYDFLSEFGSVLEMDWGLDSDLLTQLKMVTFSMSFAGDEASEKVENTTICMICYDGMWYPIDFTAGRAVEITFLIQRLVWEIMDY